eukprot:403362628
MPSSDTAQLNTTSINLLQEEHPLLIQYRKAIDFLEEVNKKLIKEKRKRRFWQDKVKLMLRCQIFKRYEEEQYQMEILRDTYDMLRDQVDEQTSSTCYKILDNHSKGMVNSNKEQTEEESEQTESIDEGLGGAARLRKISKKNEGKDTLKVNKSKKEDSLKLNSKSKKIQKKKNRKQSDNDQSIIVFPSTPSIQIKQTQKLSQSSFNKATSKPPAAIVKNQVQQPQKQIAQIAPTQSKPKSQKKSKYQQNPTSNNQTTVNYQSKKQRTQAIDEFLKESIRQAKESLGSHLQLPLPTRFNQQPAVIYPAPIPYTNQIIHPQNMNPGMFGTNNGSIGQSIRNFSTVEICDENSNQSVIIQNQNSLSQAIVDGGQNNNFNHTTGAAQGFINRL